MVQSQAAAGTGVRETLPGTEHGASCVWVVFAGSFWLVRNQQTVDDVSYIAEVEQLIADLANTVRMP